MNTPSHLILNLALLGRRPEPRLRWLIAAGALLPDLPMFVFYAWNRLVVGLPEDVIWGSLYFESTAWRALFDSFNSFPIFGALLVIGLALRRPGLVAFSASVLLHCLFDLPIHHDDGHRHFFPFSDWIFNSPVSYWDPAHHGAWASAVELALVLGCTAILWPRIERRRYRTLLGGTCGVMLIGWLGFYGRSLLAG